MSSRFSITRRPALDLPLPASGRPDGAADPGAASVEPDFDLHRKFDVPAFLRRQENWGASAAVDLLLSPSIQNR